MCVSGHWGSCKNIITCQQIYSAFQNIQDLNAMLFSSQGTIITKEKKIMKTKRNKRK